MSESGSGSATRSESAGPEFNNGLGSRPGRKSYCANQIIASPGLQHYEVSCAVPISPRPMSSTCHPATASIIFPSRNSSKFFFYIIKPVLCIERYRQPGDDVIDRTTTDTTNLLR